MSQLDQLNEMEKSLKHIAELDQELGQIKGYHQGWEDGFDLARKMYCSHPSTALEDVGDSDNIRVVCTLCEKVMGEEK